MKTCELVLLAVALSGLVTHRAFADRRPIAPLRPNMSRYVVQGSMNNKAGIKVVKVVGRRGPTSHEKTVRQGHFRVSNRGNILAKIKGASGKTEALAVYNPRTGQTVLNIAGKRLQTKLAPRIAGKYLFKRLAELVPEKAQRRQVPGFADLPPHLIPPGATRYVVQGSMNDKAGIKVVKVVGLELSFRDSTSRVKTVRQGQLRMNDSGKILAKIQGATGKTEALAVYNPRTGRTAYTAGGKRLQTVLPPRIANKYLFNRLAELVPTKAREKTRRRGTDGRSR